MWDAQRTAARPLGESADPFDGAIEAGDIGGEVVGAAGVGDQGAILGALDYAAVLEIVVGAQRAGAGISECGSGAGERNREGVLVEQRGGHSWVALCFAMERPAGGSTMAAQVGQVHAEYFGFAFGALRPARVK